MPQPMIDELTGSDRIAARMEDLEETMRRSFEALIIEIDFIYHYHPSKMTTPGQVDDRPGLTGIEYIGQYYGG